MKLAYFYITFQGEELAKQLRVVLPGKLFGKENLKENFILALKEYEGLICIMAAGITVRMVAPYLNHKTKDPAIVVVDQRGQYAISLLSGHLGGANRLAETIASITGGQAVITTATDVEKQISFDQYAKDNQRKIENIGELKYISGALLHGKKIEVYCWNKKEEEQIENYCREKQLDNHKIQFVDRIEEIKTDCGVCITPYVGVESVKDEITACQHLLILRPMILTMGMGCKKDRDRVGVLEAIEEVLKKARVSPLSLKQIATIPRKGQEKAIQEAIHEYQVPLCFIEEDEIAKLDLKSLQIKESEFVQQTIGVASVSTASAYLASGGGTILVDKAKFSGLTLALVLELST